MGYISTFVMRFKMQNIKSYVKYLPEYLKAFKYQNYIQELKKNHCKYGIVRGTNEQYLFDIRDKAIPMEMFNSKDTFSKKDIDEFFRLAKKYCEIEPGGGVMLDIGANIGTTSIYVDRNISRGKVEIYSFEPDVVNFRCLSSNIIINQCRNVYPYNIAASDHKDKIMMTVNLMNRAGTKVVNESMNYDKNSVEIVDCDRMDAVLSAIGVNPIDVKYIWIDTEGHEAYAIEGMIEMLCNYHPCMFMELTPRKYKGLRVTETDFDLLYKNLNKAYDRVVIPELGDKAHRLDKIDDLFHNSERQWNVFLFKLNG